MKMKKRKKKNLFFPPFSIFQTTSLYLYYISFSTFSLRHVELAAHDRLALVVVHMRDSNREGFVSLGGLFTLTDCTKSVIYPLEQ